jgi:hypothetical protein
MIDLAPQPELRENIVGRPARQNVRVRALGELGVGLGIELYRRLAEPVHVARSPDQRTTRIFAFRTQRYAVPGVEIVVERPALVLEAGSIGRRCRSVAIGVRNSLTACCRCGPRRSGRSGSASNLDTTRAQLGIRRRYLARL